MGLEPGLTGRASRFVTDELTAIALGSGDVPVLATPAVLALVEAACVDAVRDAIPDGSTSVGTWAELEHLLASAPGALVEATARLESVDGRTLTFSAEARDGDAVVARAKHRRAIVNREKFLSRAH